MLLISEDLDEILALSDRVLVMYEGELTGEFDPDSATVEEIGLAMAGGERTVIRIERRLEQPLWLSRRSAVRIGRRSPSSSSPPCSAITGHDPITTYRRIFDAAFVGCARPGRTR